MKHPNYPDIEFKPSLAVYDYDQTYDLIHIASSYPQIYFNFGTQAITEFLEGNAILVDRYDYSLFPFAKEYAKKIYDKLSKYNNTQNIVNYNVNGYQSQDKTGIDYGSYQFNDSAINDYQIEWDQEDQAYDGFSCNITLNIPAHDYDIYIAYYGSTYSLPYNTDSVLSLNKCYLKIPATDKSGEVTLKFENTPQICSIIPFRITESGYQQLSDIKALFNQLSKGWLYDNLDTLLTIINDEIQANFKHLDKGMKITTNFSYDIIQSSEYDIELSSGWKWWHNDNTGILINGNTNFELINLPNWYNDWKIFRSANNQRIADNLQPDYFDDGNDYYLRKSSNSNLWGETVTYVIPSFKKLILSFNSQFIVDESLNSFSKSLIYNKHYDVVNNFFNPYFNNRDYRKINYYLYQVNYNYTNNHPAQPLDLVLYETHLNVVLKHKKLKQINYFINGTTLNYAFEYQDLSDILLEHQWITEIFGLGDGGSTWIEAFSDTVGQWGFSGGIVNPELLPNPLTYSTSDFQQINQTFNDTEPQDYFLPINYLSEYELILMNDSLRTKEIHASLNADKYAWINDNGTAIPATHSLGWKIEKIAQALGILFDLSGNIQSLRQSKRINQGDTIAEGWYLGQFGINQGGQTAYNAQQGGLETEERLGLAYEIKSNQFTKDPSTGEASLGSSGYVLVESIPQLLHVILQDLDKCLGLQELGAYVIENPNYYKDSPEKPYFTFEGLGDLIKELTYTIANISKNATQANIGILKTQATTNEILSALGLPTIEKTILINTSEGVQQEVNYPALNPASMSLADLHFIQMQNLALLNQGTIELNIKD